MSLEMEVIEHGESYEEVDGDYQFVGTLVVYRQGHNLYHAFTKSRCQSAADVKIQELSNTVLIPAEAYCPLFLSTYTRAPDPLPPGCFIKKPRLLSYDRARETPAASSISERVLKEVNVCEILKSNPHPNIAQYLGFQVQGTRISSICYAKYDSTLMHLVNPQSRMKRDVVYGGKDLKSLEDSLTGVESGLRHLHSLGLVHNDINPSNIMFHGESPVIIDFDSCRPIGDSLEGVGRTYEWYDESVERSMPSNDFDALNEIRAWLKVDGAQSFKFIA